MYVLMKMWLHALHYFIGNQVDNACRYSPAGSPDVISAGATTRNDGLYRSFLEGTNYGRCVTLFAPGQLVTAATDHDRYM